MRSIDGEVESSAIVAGFALAVPVAITAVIVLLLVLSIAASGKRVVNLG